MDKIKSWWSEDGKWFCLLVNDGVNQATVSLTRAEAKALAGEIYDQARPPNSSSCDCGAMNVNGAMYGIHHAACEALRLYTFRCCNDGTKLTAKPHESGLVLDHAYPVNAHKL